MASCSALSLDGATTVQLPCTMASLAGKDGTIIDGTYVVTSLPRPRRVERYVTPR